MAAPTDPIPLAAYIGTRLRGLRKDRGVSAARIAEIASQDFGLHWTTATVYELEKGRRRLTLGEWFLLGPVLIVAGVADPSEGAPADYLLRVTEDASVEVVPGVPVPASELYAVASDPRSAHPLSFDTRHLARLRERYTDSREVALFNERLSAAEQEKAKRADRCRRLWPSADDAEIDVALCTRGEEAVRKAAAQLNASREDVAVAAHALWNCSLTRKREAEFTSRWAEGMSPESAQRARGHITRSLIKELEAKLESVSGET